MQRFPHCASRRARLRATRENKNAPARDFVRRRAPAGDRVTTQPFDGGLRRSEATPARTRQIHSCPKVSLDCFRGPARASALRTGTENTAPGPAPAWGRPFLVRDDGDTAEGRQLIKILAACQRVPGD